MNGKFNANINNGVDATDALVLLVEITNALKYGTKHYRRSDNKLLTTVEEILQALLDEGSIILVPKKDWE